MQLIIEGTNNAPISASPTSQFVSENDLVDATGDAIAFLIPRAAILPDFSVSDPDDPGTAQFILDNPTAPGLTLSVVNGDLLVIVNDPAQVDALNTAGVLIFNVSTGIADPGGAVLGGRSFNIFVSGVNDAPIARDDGASTAEDTPVIISILSNDFDPDDPITITTIGSAANGSVVDNGNGTVTYTPNTNFNGTDSFTYTITDGITSDTATVTIDVGGVNDNPVIVTPASSPTVIENAANITIDGN